MKILTLFLALFLSLLPKGTPVADYSPGEEVVIRVSQNPEKQPQILSSTVYTDIDVGSPSWNPGFSFF